MPKRNSLLQKHNSAKSIQAYRKAQRKKDAETLAELVYDIFKEKKRKENDKIKVEQNDVQTQTN